MGRCDVSLDVYLSAVRPTEVYSGNITHNLARMAEVCGLYRCIWRPEELGITKAEALIGHLQEGLKRLREDPDEYRRYNASNGWGVYEDFVAFVEGYLAACVANPDAEVSVWR